jgi:hypothetical protein
MIAPRIDWSIHTAARGAGDPLCGGEIYSDLALKGRVPQGHGQLLRFAQASAELFT